MTPKEGFSTFPQPDQDRRVMAAWEQFLRRHDVPPHAVRDVIEGSWERCSSSGVDPERSQAAMPLPEEALRALQHAHRDLLGASMSITEQARDFLSQSGTIMILTDPTGAILETVGDAATVEVARNIRLETGAVWDEGACGTNAIGTALALGGPVQVHGAEHFCSGIKPWTCSATVIRDPIHGEVLGVLDVSGQRDSFSRHCLALFLCAGLTSECETDRSVRRARHGACATRDTVRDPGRWSSAGTVVRRGGSMSARRSLPSQELPECYDAPGRAPEWARP